MKIANIIYESELVNHDRVEFINYYQVTDQSSFDLKKINYLLPTLIVGWKFLRKSFPNSDASILKHTIVKEKLYWEFSFDENKSSHVNGIQNFVNNVPIFYFHNKYKYINLDPIFFNISNNQELFDVLPKEINGFYVINNRMLYILSGKKIYGLDIELYDFFKFNIDGLYKKLEKINNGLAIFDTESEYYKKYSKIFLEFPYLRRYLIAILS